MARVVVFFLYLLEGDHPCGRDRVGNSRISPNGFKWLAQQFHEGDVALVEEVKVPRDSH